jgi:hypothetical protein
VRDTVPYHEYTHLACCNEPNSHLGCPKDIGMELDPYCLARDLPLPPQIATSILHRCLRSRYRLLKNCPSQSRSPLPRADKIDPPIPLRRGWALVVSPCCERERRSTRGCGNHRIPDIVEAWRHVVTYRDLQANSLQIRIFKIDGCLHPDYAAAAAPSRQMRFAISLGKRR